MRTRTLLLLATSLTVATIAIAGVAAGGVAPSDSRHAHTPQPLGQPRPRGVMRASAVLRGWDHRRAGAWSRVDTAALAGLYTSGSRTGRQDVRDLRRWRGRDLRVIGLRQQVAELVVEVETPRRMVLAVTDRTVDGVAVGPHRRTALPSSTWAGHRIRLRRAHGRWLVEEVVAQPAR